VPPGLRGNMHRILRAEVIEAIARQDLSSAFAIQSPQIFLSELDAFPKPAPTGPVSDRILVANATLAAGGAERQIVALAQALLGQGIPADRLHFALFSLVTDRGHDHFLPILRDLGVHVHDLRSQMVPDNSPAHVASFALPRPLRDDVLPLAELVRKLRPQVLHGWQDRAAVAAGWVGMAEGVPRVVMSARNMQPQRRGASQPYIAPILTALANQPTMQMTANSMAGARDYEDWLGLPFERVATLYNGIGSFGVPLPHGSVTPHNRLVIGGVFRLAANKRPFLWLDTIRALVDCLPDFAISARLVGTGPLRADILAHAHSIGLDRFELASTLHQPTEIYDGMDAMLLMSRVEGLPNVVLEAQALGLPVAACDVGGVREAVYVGPVGGGLILHADTTAAQAAQELAQWIIGVRGHGAAQRRDFVASRYGLDALGKKVVSLYQGQTDPGPGQ
jgi:glycosyltransferase involved in cell wall biosynthesis